MSLNPRRFPTAALFLALILAGCAKVAGPPGGPVDKTGPEVVATYPVENALEVDAIEFIAVDFSENIEKKSIKEAVFISPRFDEEPELKWKGRQLRIIPPDSLADNTTYIINIAAEVRDLRNNKMDNSFTFAFSTGESISRGIIEGTVIKDGKALSGATIGLYHDSTVNYLDHIDSIDASYITVSGKEGDYNLRFLPDGDYFIMAFDDKNNNRRLDFPREAYGLPDRSVGIEAGETLDAINLYMNEQDTSTVTILSAAVTENRLVKVRFTEKISSDTLINNRQRIYLIGSGETETKIPVSSIKEPTETEGTIYNLFFPGLDSGIFRIRIDRSIMKPADTAEREYLESPDFEVTYAADETAPKVESVAVATRPIFPSEDRLEILFSEPVQKARVEADGVTMSDGDSTDLSLAYDWRDDFRLRVTADELVWNMTYDLRIDGAAVYDLAGNRTTDSVLSFSLATYDEDSLGSVSGKVMVGEQIDSAGVIFLIFDAIQSRAEFRREISGNDFSFVLPPDKYILSGFIDRNGNLRHDCGTLRPFRLSETAAVYADTIRVRARFETADIEFHFK